MEFSYTVGLLYSRLGILVDLLNWRFRRSLEGLRALMQDNCILVLVHSTGEPLNPESSAETRRRLGQWAPSALLTRRTTRGDAARDAQRPHV